MGLAVFLLSGCSDSSKHHVSLGDRPASRSPVQSLASNCIEYPEEVIDRSLARDGTLRIAPGAVVEASLPRLWAEYDTWIADRPKSGVSACALIEALAVDGSPFTPNGNSSEGRWSGPVDLLDAEGAEHGKRAVDLEAGIVAIESSVGQPPAYRVSLWLADPQESETLGCDALVPFWPAPTDHAIASADLARADDQMGLSCGRAFCCRTAWCARLHMVPANESHRLVDLWRGCDADDPTCLLDGGRAGDPVNALTECSSTHFDIVAEMKELDTAISSLWDDEASVDRRGPRCFPNDPRAVDEPGAGRVSFGGAGCAFDCNADGSWELGMPDFGVEICDDFDNDCDGRVDNLPSVPCQVGRGACRRDGHRPQTCGDPPGVGTCSAVPGAPSDEVCNGLDDDCDGLPDEPFSVRRPCARGKGQCRRTGTIQCDGVGTSCSAEPGTPDDDDPCNDADDDCDGRVDEAHELVPCDTEEHGLCKVGLLRCVRGQEFCEPRRKAKPETCDGLDNDCDGRTDEWLPSQRCSTGQPGACNPGWTVCVRGEEMCARVTGPQEETCNGIDDDCDGTVDDDVPRVHCNTGFQGICRDGTTTCEDGESRCMGVVEPYETSEICDGSDQDCDGRVDEGLNARAEPCETHLDGACADGTLRCVGGEPSCVPDRRRDAVGEDDRRCNNIDDDCDGSVDEGSFGDCDVGQGVCRNVGELYCDGANLSCSARMRAPAGEEICNGSDDDCDGTTDEDIGRGRDCEPGGEGVCTRKCQEGEWVCNPVAGDIRPEVCNGQDDDCDGGVDNVVGVEGEAEVCRGCGQLALPDGPPDCGDYDYFFLLGVGPSCAADGVCGCPLFEFCNSDVSQVRYAAIRERRCPTQGACYLFVARNDQGLGGGTLTAMIVSGCQSEEGSSCCVPMNSAAANDEAVVFNVDRFAEEQVSCFESLHREQNDDALSNILLNLAESPASPCHGSCEGCECGP